MPSRIFWAYVKMMSVIENRRAITHTNQLTYSFGSMSKEESESFRFRISKGAVLEGDGHDPGVVRPRSPMEMAGLAGSGTAVIMQPGPKTRSSSTPVGVQEKEIAEASKVTQ